MGESEVWEIVFSAASAWAIEFESVSFAGVVVLLGPFLATCMRLAIVKLDFIDVSVRLEYLVNGKTEEADRESKPEATQSCNSHT